MPSFDNVNYSLRPNKNVERKLIFEAIQHLGPLFDLPSYQYVGMGSMWFVDFILAHKLLRIEKMISIERAEHADRADFNKPYGCIEVWPGDTTNLLPDIDYTQPTIFWLDYDSGLEGPVLQDCRYVAGHAETGSIVLITVNAHYKRLPEKDSNDNVMSRIEALKYLIGDLAPSNIKSSNLNKKNYPATVGDLLHRHIKSSLIQAGRNLNFEPLFHYHYSDNAPMITVGGVFVDDDTQEKMKSCSPKLTFEHVTGTEVFKVNIPALTQKEKTAIDQMLPAAADIDADTMRETLGFLIEESQIAAYSRFYRLYPIFGELQL